MVRKWGTALTFFQTQLPRETWSWENLPSLVHIGDEVCVLLWGLGAQVGTAAKAVALPDLVAGQYFPGLIIQMLFHPMHFSENHLN